VRMEKPGKPVVQPSATLTAPSTLIFLSSFAVAPGQFRSGEQLGF